ncbi:MAG: hypothetical protein ACOY5R_04845 [Pseudomonadota bacterium]
MTRLIAEGSGRPEPWKIAAIVLSLALGMAAGADSLANVSRFSEPERTLRLRPDDAMALTTAEDRRRALVDPTATDIPVMATIARTALRSEPLTPVALRQLAVAEVMAGRQASSDRLLDLAHRLSRRELGTSWLLINRSLDQGDAVGLARSFDEALTTSAGAAELLSPALVDGLFDEGVRGALVPYIRSDRPWMPAFLRSAAAGPDAVSNTALMILAAGGLPDTPRYADTDAYVLTGLAARRDFPLAARYLREAVRLPAGFATNGAVGPASLDSRAGPFGWRFKDGAEGSALAGDGNAIIVRAEADRRVPVSDRVLLLAPGRYALRLRGEVPDGRAPAIAEVALRCIGSSTTDLIVGPAVIGTTSGPVNLPFAVPADCPAQRVEIVATGKAIDGEGELTLSDWRIDRL